MAKKRKQTGTQPSTNAETIPEEEQWRIIEQTGVLKNVPSETQAPAAREPSSDDEEDSLFCNEIFNSALLVIPFSSLYIMMDMCVLLFPGSKYRF